MSRRLIVLTVLFIALAAPATAATGYGGRPVADLRFDGYAFPHGALVASDGADFLILSDTGYSGNTGAFTQKISGGRVIGPQRLIGRGAGVGLFWTGNEYLAGLADEAGQLRIMRLSRDGSSLDTSSEPVLTSYATRLAASATSALAFGWTGSELIAQPLDLGGRPVGAPSRHTTPVQEWDGTLAAGAAAGGFAAVLAGWDGTWLMLFRADGSALGPPIVLDGPYSGSIFGYHSNQAVVATDGEDTLVVFGAGDDAGAELKSVVVGATGTVKSVHVLHTSADGDAWYGIVPFGLVWDGSQYFASATIDRDPTSDQRDVDPAVVRISRNGERAGALSWVAEEKSWQLGSGLAWNGRQLLVTTPGWYVGQARRPSFYVVDPATLTAGGPVRFAQTLPSHSEVAIEAGAGGYLAAWIELSDGLRLRASRLDASANYVDGEGLLLDTSAAAEDFTARSIAIDGAGPRWLVVWSDGVNVRGSFVPYTGAPAAGGAFAIGAGQEAAVRWDGSRYVVLRSDGSLHRDIVTAEGVVSETSVLAARASSGATSTTYVSPRLVSLGGRIVAIFAKQDRTCQTPTRCFVSVAIRGLPLDVANATPFEIGGTSWPADVSVATAGTRALVLWSTSYGVLGAFISAGAVEHGVILEGVEYTHSLAFDGTDFVAAWRDYSVPDWELVTARISTAGAVGTRAHLRMADYSFAYPSVAASPSLPALIAYIDQRDAWENVRRGMLLFASEVAAEPPPPSPPSIQCVSQEAEDVLTVRWQRIASGSGISIELQLPDGSFRSIGVAPEGATTARVPLDGLRATGLRLRAWNLAGVSAPSAFASPQSLPDAVVRSTMQACSGVPVTIRMTLIGAPPFTVRWSDGLVQSGLARSAVRVVTITADKTFRIVSVEDSCSVRKISESVRITVDPQPAIAEQTRRVRLPPGQSATLTVTANEDARFAWFEGSRGDTTQPVGANTGTYTTPSLTHSTRYWVRVSNDCGSVDSEEIEVTVSARRRSARR